MGHLSSLEVDSDHLSYEKSSLMIYVGIGMGWDGIWLDEMVIIGDRYSKSTFGAKNGHYTAHRAVVRSVSSC